MELLLLEKDRFSVLAPQSLLDSLASAPANMKGHAAGFKSLFELYAEAGREKLSDDQFHPAGPPDIWRFRKGNLRVYCFKDGDSLIVLSHCNTKFKQKTAKADLKESDEMRTAYLEAKSAKSLRITPIEKDDSDE